MGELRSRVRHWSPAIIAIALSAFSLHILTHVSVPSIPQIHFAQPVYVNPPNNPVSLTSARSLFPAPPRVDVADEAGQTANVVGPPTLAGIAIGGGRGIALLRPQAGGTIIAHTGDVVDGWTLLSLSRSEAVIGKGDERRALIISAAGQQTSSPQP